MMKSLKPLCILFMAAIGFVSCLSDDQDEVVLYNDCMITSFAVATAPIYVHTTSSTDEDSVYVSHGNAMDDYHFVIDQRNGLIFNEDSLPLNVDPTRLICACTTKNNGLVFIKHVDNDSLKYFSSADSTDFSVERKLIVYSTDGTSKKEYSVKVNVHQQDGTEFKWNKLADNTDIAAMQNVKALMLNETLVVAGEIAGNTQVLTSIPSAGNSWTNSATTFGADAWKNIVVKTGSLYILDGDKLYVSEDAVNFIEKTQATTITRLVGASSSELYALGTSGTLMVSADDGLTWTEDKLDDDATLLPVDDIAYVCKGVSGVDGVEQVVIVGNRDASIYAGETAAVVWRKNIGDGREAKWVLMSASGQHDYTMPRLSAISLGLYDNNILACGGPAVDGNVQTPYKRFYQSRDGGITWKMMGQDVFPAEFDAGATSCAIAVGADNMIHLIATGTGQVWRGRLAELGWTNK